MQRNTSAQNNLLDEVKFKGCTDTCIHYSMTTLMHHEYCCSGKLPTTNTTGSKKNKTEASVPPFLGESSPDGHMKELQRTCSAFHARLWILYYCCHAAGRFPQPYSTTTPTLLQSLHNWSQFSGPQVLKHKIQMKTRASYLRRVIIHLLHVHPV